MKTNEIKLLEYLGHQDDWVTSTKISYDLSFSRRTIQYCVKSINEEYPNLITSSRNGFKIVSKQQLSSILSNSQVIDIPQTEADRKTLILKSLLFSNESKDLDELAQELFISSSTLNNELIKIKLELSEFDLIFKTKSNVASIEGLEKNKKKMISSLIYKDTKDNFMNLDSMQKYLPMFDLHRVKRIVTESLKNFEYFIDDFSLLNFVLHIAITMERNKLDHHLSIKKSSHSNRTLISAHINQIIKTIAKDIENEYSVSFSESDCYDLALLIMTRVVNLKSESIDQHQLIDIVGQDVLDLVHIIQQRTLNDFLIKLDQQDFTFRFSLHIRNLFIRLENKIELRNPQMINIKTSFPFIYDISVFIANIIHQYHHVSISEDEIAYIALHIGVLIEEQKALENKLTAVILNPQYFSNSLNILKKCIKIFNDSLIISEVIMDESEIKDHQDFDLLISTIPVHKIIDKQVVLITEYMSHTDIAEIANAIDKALKYKKVMRIESKLKTMFNESCFSIDNNFNNEKEAIHKMASDLFKLGYVNDDFENKLYERESISSSAFGTIAMPHPLEMCSKKSVISVSIHQKPLQWQDNLVNIIFMLAINDEDRIIFKDIFDFITDTISDETKLFSLIRVKTFDEFIKLIANYSN